MRSSKKSAQHSTKLSTRSLVRQESDNSDLAICCAEKLFTSIDSPTSLGLYLCIKYKDWNSLVTHSVRPDDYTDPYVYALDNQACKFLSKYVGLDLGIDLERRTFDIFLAGETSCRETNSFIRRFANGGICLPSNIENVLYDAQLLIKEILGSLCIDEWLDSCRFGPGVSSHFPHGKSDYVKLSRNPSVTKEFELHARSLLSEYPCWKRALTYDDTLARSPDVIAVPGGTYAQVPKNARVNRNIETQPLLNGFAQLGLGLMLRRRLSAVGIDLNDQTRNQKLAKLGSLYGSYCTIDLSNASDTISRELIRWLLPAEWFHAMDICRTRRIKINGSWVELERFSSMGNGFTFELESLVFYALAFSSARKVRSHPVVSVYGDDIIIPVKAYDLLAAVLHTVGFTVNHEKSYSYGPFRESCGADWFLGYQVRPFYYKEDPTNVASLISMANGLRRVAHRFNNYFGYNRRFASAWFAIYRRIPVQIRSRLAHASDADDTFILSGKLRGGFRVVRSLKLKETSQWYASIAAALYRCYIRTMHTNDPTWYCDRSISLLRGIRTKISYATGYEKEVLALERHRLDSFYLWHRDEWH